MQNLGWAGGANNGHADQIGPGPILKLGAGNYVGMIENVNDTQNLDPPNQGGAKNDTPTILMTSADGTALTFTAQDVSTSALFNVNNIVSGLTGGQTTTFKALVHAETSVQSLLFDPDDAIWKAWFHGGNVGSVRQIFYATCAANCQTAGNWNVQNGGACVVCSGAGGTWNASRVDGPVVVRVNSSLMKMLYEGQNAGGNVQIGEAESTDRGLTWTPNGGNPVLAIGAAGAWDAGSIFQPGFMYDIPTRTYIAWYGGCPDTTFTNTDGIGFAYSTDAITWTRGPFNPVLTKNTNTSGTNAFEFIIANSINMYLDNGVYRMEIKADNGVSGTTGFRGRIEASMQQTVKGGGGLLLLKVGH
jgi:hypothetical protein